MCRESTPPTPTLLEQISSFFTINVVTQLYTELQYPKALAQVTRHLLLRGIQVYKTPFKSCSIHQAFVLITMKILSIGTDRSANSANPDQSVQSLQCLPFYLHLLDALLQCKTNHSTFRTITEIRQGVLIFRTFMVCSRASICTDLTRNPDS